MPQSLCPMLCRLPGEEDNPGDIFIAIGLQEVLNQALGKHGKPLPWLNLSKFQPGHIKRHLDFVKEAGFLIIGGTPQFNNYDDWCLWYDREMWENFIVPNNIKVFPLAGGSGYPSNKMSPTEFSDHCLNSQETRRVLEMRCDHSPFFTVRDKHAFALLKKFDRKPEVQLLGCPSVFAAKARGIEWESEGNLLIVLPSPGAVPFEYIIEDTTDIAPELINQIKVDRIMKLFIVCGRALGEEYSTKPIFVAHNFPEYMLAKKHGIPEDQLFFTNDYYQMLKMYATADYVLSGRLHGAIPAFGMCGPKVVHVGIDTRMSAIDYFCGISNVRIQDLSTESAMEAMEEAEPWNNSDNHEEFFHNQVLFYRDRIRQEGFFQ